MRSRTKETSQWQPWLPEKSSVYRKPVWPQGWQLSRAQLGRHASRLCSQLGKQLPVSADSRCVSYLTAWGCLGRFCCNPSAKLIWKANRVRVHLHNLFYERSRILLTCKAGLVLAYSFTS